MESQSNDPASLLNMVKALIALRQAHPALQSNGDIRFRWAEPNAYPFVYERWDENEHVLIILNPSEREAACPLTEAPGQVLFSYNGEAQWQTGKLIVPPCSFTLCNK